MHVEVRTLNVSPSEALLAYTDQRLRASLVRLSHAVQSVVLRIKCQHGSRGGATRQCQVQLDLTSGGRVVIEEADADLYRAIDRVAARTRRTVARRLDRLRQKHRRA